MNPVQAQTSTWGHISRHRREVPQPSGQAVPPKSNWPIIKQWSGSTYDPDPHMIRVLLATWTRTQKKNGAKHRPKSSERRFFSQKVKYGNILLLYNIKILY